MTESKDKVELEEHILYPLAVEAWPSLKKWPFVCYGQLDIPKCEFNGDNFKNCKVFKNALHKYDPAKEIKRVERDSFCYGDFVHIH